MSTIYLDYNASTPIAPEVADVMRRAMDGARMAIRQARHWAGTPARQMVEKARQQVANVLSCAVQEVVFTSGGSEANNSASRRGFSARSIAGLAHAPQWGPHSLPSRQGSPDKNQKTTE